MKTRLLDVFRGVWRLLTEVPGRPDASRRIRLLRALPLMIPCALLLALVGWNTLVLGAEIRSARAAHRGLIALEAESAALRLSCSDDEARQAAAKAEEATRLILANTEDLNAQLRHWKSTARDQGWEASFQAGDTTLEPPADDALLTYFPVRGRLAPVTENTDQLSSLLRLLEHINASPKRVDVTRLAIRADDAGRYALELNLRFAARVTHEKTP